jgi:mono/diheme cytochrome c family protein
MLIRIVLMLTTGVLFVAAMEAAQQATVKHAPIKQTSPASGEEMFRTYCASCHGNDAKGDGPAAPALKMRPADLTVLAKNNGGQFPAERVQRTIRFGVETPAHGSKEMPIWGPALESLNPSNRTVVQQRVSNLAEYIKSIQIK